MHLQNLKKTYNVCINKYEITINAKKIKTTGKATTTPLDLLQN